MPQLSGVQGVASLPWGAGWDGWGSWGGLAMNSDDFRQRAQNPPAMVWTPRLISLHHILPHWNAAACRAGFGVNKNMPKQKLWTWQSTLAKIYHTHKPIISNTCQSRMFNWLTLVYSYLVNGHCPARRTCVMARRSWDVVICPIYMCLTVYEFSLILFHFCLFITIFIFISNRVLIVTFWIFTYYKIWILLNIYCFIWNYWIIYFVTCLQVFWSVMN